ncbi:SidA/IucD/PvdA family monooxygenase [Streptomyces globisporus]|uniref:SidA/IucD/PvdA family monooxygenase n=1 Tax=Streptomyces globisporus TaxID=1908 RepID=UPI00068FE4FD
MNQPPTAPYDLLGVGIGPFNLSLAALCEQVPDLTTLFCEVRTEFRWHPGLLIDGARMQVPFLADLVSLVDPTNPWSFLNYLRHQQRLFPFYFTERFHLPRREYEHYCRWAAERLPNCRFGTQISSVHWDSAEGLFRVTPGEREVAARNVVLGVGIEPYRPTAFAALADHPQVWHCAQYLDRRSTLAGVQDITVLCSGQSGAEVFLDLLCTRTGDGTRLRWLTRTRVRSLGPVTVQ